MIKQYRRRGALARLRRRLTFLGRAASDEASPEYPIRARPERVQFIEEYRYTLTVGRNAVYTPQPDRTVGEIQIDLPFDKMGRETMVDAAHSTGHEVGPIVGRYGWLGLTRVLKTDIHDRFATVRSWSDPAYSAFPLVVPLLDDKTELLEHRIEQGGHEREYLDYTPQAPVPFPFRLDLFMSRDSAVPTDPRPANATTEHRLATPTSATGKEMTIHVRLTFALRRPPALAEADCQVVLDRFQLNWPVPLVASQFSLRDAPGARLQVDSRFNQLYVEGVKATLTSSGSGPVRGHLNFRIVVTQPAVLQGTAEVRGMMRIAAHGLTLSGVRAQYFDAAGYPQDEGCNGGPLIHYQSLLFANFTYSLAEALKEPPTLLERHYSWVGSESGPNPFREVLRNLQERNFELDPSLSEDKGNYVRWWATRVTDGQPLVLDVEMEKRELPRTLLGPVVGKQKEQVVLTDGPTRGYYELTIRGYYRGRWEEAAQQIAWLEERLRQRLHLRYQSQ